MSLEVKMKECWIVDLGTIDYKEALELQRKLVELRADEKVYDILLLLEHPHTITIGKNPAGDMFKDISRGELESKGIRVYDDVGRGGSITYHGPGQLVAYAIRKIDFNEQGKHINGLERVMVDVANQFGVSAYKSHERDPRDPEGKKRLRGAWYGKDSKFKLGALGIDLDSRNGASFTMHGFALNVNTDLSYFDYIYPCGLKDKIMISLRHVLGREVDMKDVKEKAADSFAKEFEYSTVNKSYEELRKLLQSQ